MVGLPCQRADVILIRNIGTRDRPTICGCDSDGGVSMAEKRGCGDDGDGGDGGATGGGSEGGAGGGGRWRDRDDVVKVAAVVAWCSVGDDSGCEMKVEAVAGKWPDSDDDAKIIKRGRSVVCVG
ncbi:hypothetical protein Tco_0859366 [Tanacetum coccineum]|uniref:Uncharacterized protein n=1 Tax=Tanacetum coccineum TaxID=301880 RepID=A0ABQ5BHI2_9ASTR